MRQLIWNMKKRLALDFSVDSVSGFGLIMVLILFPRAELDVGYDS